MPYFFLKNIFFSRNTSKQMNPTITNATIITGSNMLIAPIISATMLITTAIISISNNKVIIFVPPKYIIFFYNINGFSCEKRKAMIFITAKIFLQLKSHKSAITWIMYHNFIVQCIFNSAFWNNAR